jgi:hypothetical protein
VPKLTSSRKRASYCCTPQPQPEYGLLHARFTWSETIENCEGEYDIICFFDITASGDNMNKAKSHLASNRYIYQGEGASICLQHHALCYHTLKIEPVVLVGLEGRG